MLSETSISPSEVQGVGKKGGDKIGGSVANAVSWLWPCCYNQNLTAGQANEICMKLGPSPFHHGRGGANEAPPLSRIYWLLMAAEGGGVIFSSGVAIGKLSCSNK